MDWFQAHKDAQKEAGIAYDMASDEEKWYAYHKTYNRLMFDAAADLNVDVADEGSPGMITPEQLRRVRGAGPLSDGRIGQAADAWEATEKALYNLSEGHGCVLRVDHETRRARPSTLLQEEK